MSHSNNSNLLAPKTLLCTQQQLQHHCRQHLAWRAGMAYLISRWISWPSLVPRPRAAAISGGMLLLLPEAFAEPLPVCFAAELDSDVFEA